MVSGFFCISLLYMSRTQHYWYLSPGGNPTLILDYRECVFDLISAHRNAQTLIKHYPNCEQVGS